MEETKLPYVNDVENYSLTKTFNYVVRSDDYALNGLELLGLEVIGEGFTDAYGNSLVSTIDVSKVGMNFENTFIETGLNVLTITATSTNMTQNELNENETSDSNVTYTFKFNEEIANDSFKKDDISVLVDDVQVDESMIGTLTRVDSKTYTLNVSNAGIIGPEDKEGKIQTVVVSKNVSEDVMGNGNDEAKTSIRIKRTLQEVVSNYVSGSVLPKGTGIYYKTLDAIDVITYTGNTLKIKLTENTTKLLNVIGFKNDFSNSNEVNFEYVIKTKWHFLEELKNSKDVKEIESIIENEHNQIDKRRMRILGSNSSTQFDFTTFKADYV